MVWVAAVLFIVVGILIVVRRDEIARGQSMLWGGTTLPGCVILQGVFLALVGLAFIIAWQLGYIGGR